mmetsp:Transcript_46278/g.74210  ORF Transcript_46278/g.74210 Transcript_46278/m.74210 type:complete len:206 (-) Transcript_46278:493-1110(-)
MHQLYERSASISSSSSSSLHVLDLFGVLVVQFDGIFVLLFALLFIIFAVALFWLKQVGCIRGVILHVGMLAIDLCLAVLIVRILRSLLSHFAAKAKHMLDLLGQPAKAVIVDHHQQDDGEDAHHHTDEQNVDPIQRQIVGIEVFAVKQTALRIDFAIAEQMHCEVVFSRRRHDIMARFLWSSLRVVGHIHRHHLVLSGAQPQHAR